MSTLKSISLAFLIFVFGWNNSQAQIPSKIDANWVFSLHNQISFNGPFPDTIPGTLLDSSSVRCASVSDDDGNLLFYTNGINVWNANNIIMPWSHDSCPSGSLYHYFVSGRSSRVSIAHIPLQLEKYYIFTFKEHGSTGELDAYYTEVDMSLNNGMGDVNPFKKNVFFKQNVLGDL
ncbi:MAG: hypothetical protein K9I34_05620, partial [Bacteroidales bacterium]|nr:hypothetical protein [Bacteroidales bacterium]